MKDKRRSDPQRVNYMRLYLAKTKRDPVKPRKTGETRNKSRMQTSDSGQEHTSSAGKEAAPSARRGLGV